MKEWRMHRRNGGKYRGDRCEDGRIKRREGNALIRSYGAKSSPSVDKSVLHRTLPPINENKKGVVSMKKLNIVPVLALLMTLVLGVGCDKKVEEMKAKADEATKKVEGAANKGMDGVKKGASSASGEMKKMGEAAKDGAAKVGDAAKDGAAKVKEGAAAVGDLAKDGAAKVKDGAAKVGDAAKKGVTDVKKGADAMKKAVKKAPSKPSSSN